MGLPTRSSQHKDCLRRVVHSFRSPNVNHKRRVSFTQKKTRRFYFENVETSPQLSRLGDKFANLNLRN